MCYPTVPNIEGVGGVPPARPPSPLFGVEDSGFGVQGSGFRVQGLRFGDLSFPPCDCDEGSLSLIRIKGYLGHKNPPPC